MIIRAYHYHDNSHLASRHELSVRNTLILLFIVLNNCESLFLLAHKRNFNGIYNNMYYFIPLILLYYFCKITSTRDPLELLQYRPCHVSKQGRYVLGFSTVKLDNIINSVVRCKRYVTLLSL